MSDAPAVIDNTEGFGLERVVDEADDADKDVDMEGKVEAEEVSQCDEEEQANCDEEPAEADDGPTNPEAEIDPDTAEIENKPENENENDLDKGENNEDPSLDGDLEDQEIESQLAHRAESLNVLTSIELKFALLREWIYVKKMETLAWEGTMIQACMSSFSILVLLVLIFMGSQLSILKCNICNKK